QGESPLRPDHARRGAAHAVQGQEAPRRDDRADRAVDRPGRAVRPAAHRAVEGRSGPGGALGPGARLLVVPAAGVRRPAAGAGRGTGWTWRGSPSRTATSRTMTGRMRTTIATS